MAETDVTGGLALEAGNFSDWLAGMKRALGDQSGSDVPCGGCTACCTSSQFVHIGPDETETLARIPVRLRFPAPRLPKGHVLLGYDERGHCPMMVDGACSIYEHRPRTCRTYDCRVFPAAGIEVDEPGKADVAERVTRWRFDFPDDDDHVVQDAVQAAARFVADHPELLPAGADPASQTQRAVLAVELVDAFLTRDDDTGRRQVAEPDHDDIRAILAR